MPQVFTRDGRQVEMPAEEAQEAFLRGEVGFAPGEHQVNMGGEMRPVKAEDLKSVLKLGGTLVGDEQLAQAARVEEWDTTGGALATGAIEAGNALTLGLLDVGATQLLGEEYAQSRRDMREANPDAALVGQIGGEVVGVLGSGGLGAALKGGAGLALRGAAATPAGLATRAAIGAETGLANILGRGVAAKTASVAAGAAVETSLFEMGRALSDASIQEGDHSAEEIMARMGEWAANDLPTTAALGGAVGGVFGLTFAGASKIHGRRSAAERAAGAPAQKEIFLDRRVREALNSDDLMEGLSELGEEARTIAPKSGDIVTEVATSFRDGEKQMAQAKNGLSDSLDRSFRSTAEVLGLTKVHTANINNITTHLARDGYNAPEIVRAAEQLYGDAFDSLGLDAKMMKGLQGQKLTVERQLGALDRLDERGAQAFVKSQKKAVADIEKKFANAPRAVAKAAKAERTQLKKAVDLQDLRDLDEPSNKQRARIADLEAEGIGDISGHVNAIILRIEKATGERELVGTLEELVGDLSVVQLRASPSPASRTTLNAELNRLEAQLTKRGQVVGIDEAEKRGLSQLSLLMRESKSRMDEILTGNAQNTQVAARVYAELDVLNRRVGRLASERSPATALVKDQARQLHEALRVQMLDKATWGTGLTAQRERLNSAWASWYDNIRGTEVVASRGKGRRLAAFDEEGNRLVDSADIDPFARAPEADRRKVEGFMDRIGDRANGTPEREVLRWVDSQKNLIMAVSETTGEISAAQAKAAVRNLDDVRSAMMSGARTKVQGDAFVRSMGSLAEVARMARGVPALRGGAGFLLDPTAGIVGLFAGDVETLVAKAVTTQTGQSMLARLRNRGQTRVGGAVSGFIKKVTSGKLVRAARTRAVAIPAQFGSGKSEKNRFKYGATLVRDFQEDPQAAISRGINAMGPMASATPNTSAMFGSRLHDQGTFLAQKLPALPRTAAFGKDDPDKLLDRVSRAEMRKFNRYFDAIGNPVGVLDDLAEGRVTREAVQALEAGWPILYNKVSSEIQNQLATSDADIPFTTMVQLSQLFQIPVHPALQGNRIASLQQIAREATAPQRSKSAIAPSRAVAPDMAAEFATRSQQIAGKVRG